MVKVSANYFTGERVKPIVGKVDFFADDAWLQQCYSRTSHWGLAAFSAEMIAQLYETVRETLGNAQVVVFAMGMVSGLHWHGKNKCQKRFSFRCSITRLH